MDAWDLQSQMEGGSKLGFESQYSQQACQSQTPFWPSQQSSQHPFSQQSFPAAAAPAAAAPQYGSRTLAGVPEQQARQAWRQPASAAPAALPCRAPALKTPGGALQQADHQHGVSAVPAAGSMLQPAASCQTAFLPAQPRAAAGGAAVGSAATGATAPLSSMSLEAYCQVQSLLTGGQPTVQPLQALQHGAIRAQDLKQVASGATSTWFQICSTAHIVLLTYTHNHSTEAALR